MGQHDEIYHNYTLDGSEQSTAEHWVSKSHNLCTYAIFIKATTPALMKISVLGLELRCILTHWDCLTSLFHDYTETLVRYSTVWTLPFLDNDELQAECQAFQPYNRLIHRALALPIMPFCDCYRKADKRRRRPVCCAHPACCFSFPLPLRACL